MRPNVISHPRPALLATLAVALALVAASTACTRAQAARPTYAVVTASTDPAVVARGDYLVNGPAHCANCHGDPRRRDAYERGEAVPLSGGLDIDMPLGLLHVPNITADAATGIGARTDADLVNALRADRGADGRTLLPFMDFHDLSDADLTAVISYLRTTKPVANAVAPHDMTLLGRFARAFLLPERGPAQAPVAAITPDLTPTYGAYLADHVADCQGCHTARDMRTGAFTGERYAGGLVLPSLADKTMEVVTPNLTPDPETGRIAGWSEDDFLARFRVTGAPAVKGTHMPWGAFARLTDDDLRAIYRYLKSLPAVRNATGPSLRPQST
jgi:mono/diheme cytochrome c family protein